MIPEKKHISIRINGIVQGVGMRPFIYKIAKSSGLCGYVKNEGSSVLVFVSGSAVNIDKFLHSIKQSPPPSSAINSLSVSEQPYREYDDFLILQSSAEATHYGMIPPDIALCGKCEKEIHDIGDRRSKYEFTNCTNCGPRYSIINDMPYDRETTSMSGFHMCEKCASEFFTPDHRRFNAQTNCCPDCGPLYSLTDNAGIAVKCSSPVEKARELLHKGHIIAIKGIGGYHLVCNAKDESAVMKLRERKRRPDRPLAVMCADIASVKEICLLNETEEKTITNNRRPIVLLTKSTGSVLPDTIAPGLNRYGVMLPYSPLHHFLFDNSLKYLVMTSGNISTMPICYKDSDALQRLSGTADFFLLHNREIATPVDDSVVRVVDNEVIISRIGRGYAPTALPLLSQSDILALGGQQKASVCVLHEGYAHISQYLGGLDTLESCGEYKQTQKRLARLLRSTPAYIAHDTHPGYFTSGYTQEFDLPKIAVQHHHAHMAACMAEHGIDMPCIGVIYDGTGYGTDGAVWGGEFFVGTAAYFRRAAHLEYVTIQGGDSAAAEPWRCAVSYLHALGADCAQILRDVGEAKINAVSAALENNINCYTSSSMGRLFDCISALVLRRMYATYDAQAAIELEAAIDNSISDSYPYSLTHDKGMLSIGYKYIIQGVLSDITSGKAAPYISAKFHNTICAATVECVCKINNLNGLYNVVLGGGVFENTYLLTNVTQGLKKQGFKVYYNKRVPMNDGGLSLGQAAFAAALINKDPVDRINIPNRYKEGSYVHSYSGKDNLG